MLPKKCNTAEHAQLAGLDLKMQSGKCTYESSWNVEKSTYLQAPVSIFSKFPKGRERVRIPGLIATAQPGSASSSVRKVTGSFVFRVNTAQDNWGTVVPLLPPS